MQHSIFISYRRDGGFETAKMIQEKLKLLGYKVFLDYEELRSGKFNEQLYAKIEECKDFILICSPNCFDRCSNEGDWLRLEITHALTLKQNINIVPVMVRNFKWPEVMPNGMNDLNLMQGVSASEELFDAYIKRLCSLLKSKSNFIDRLRNNGRFINFVAGTIVLPIIIIGAILIYFQYSKPFDLTILAVEKNVRPEIPFAEGQLVCVYGSKREVHVISDEVIIKEIPAAFKRKSFNIIFSANGYETVDTVVQIKKQRLFKLPIERDNSLSRVFGYITNEYSEPLSNVQVSVLDIATQTDANGRFEITIPVTKQKVYQRLRAIKEGYRTYDRKSPVFYDEEVPIVLQLKDHE